MAEPVVVSTEMVGRFMDSLWAEKDERAGWILIWGGTFRGGELTAKEARWARTSGAAAEIAGRMADEGKDVYVGVSTRRERAPSPERGTNEDSASVCGLWVDLDCGGEKKSAKTYPPDQTAVLRLIEATGRRPTSAVWSGRGVHAWWLLKEPLELPDASAREAVSFASRSWQAFIAGKAQVLGGWAVDSTADLARVLRVSGTVNRKVSGEPRQVYTLWDDGPRYGDLSDILGAAVPPASGSGTTFEQVTAGDFVIRPDADPPFDKFQALREAEPRFARSWDHTRRDLDTSMSGYDQSLACLAVMAGWSDQEVADLIVAHRRSKDPAGQSKALRPDKRGPDGQLLVKGYIRRTIDRARSGLAVGKREGEIVALSVIVDPPESEDPEKVLAHLSGIFGGLPIISVQKYGRQESSYRIVTDGGWTIEVPSTQILQSCRKFGDLIREVTKGKHSPKVLKQELWNGVVCHFYQAAEEVRIPEEEPAEQLLEWVDGYIAENQPAKGEEDVSQAISMRRPIEVDGLVAIHVPVLRRYLAMAVGEQIGQRELYRRFRKAGWTTRRVDGGIVGAPNNREARARYRYYFEPRKAAPEAAGQTSGQPTEAGQEPRASGDGDEGDGPRWTPVGGSAR